MKTHCFLLGLLPQSKNKQTGYRDAKKRNPLLRFMGSLNSILNLLTQFVGICFYCLLISVSVAIAAESWNILSLYFFVCTVLIPLQCIFPHPSDRGESVRLREKKTRLWSKVINPWKRDAAARQVGRHMFLCFITKLWLYLFKMFQIRKNSMNIFEIYTYISLFNIYISKYINMTYIYC